MNNEDYIIEYLKTALSVNTHLGCLMNCKYCIVSEISDKKIIQLCSPSEAIDKLQKNKLFIENETPITINNRSEPFLGPVRKSTCELLKILNEKKLTNPRIIISKLPPNKDEIELLNTSLGKVYFFVTYSHMPYEIEPFDKQLQINTLKTLAHKRNFYLIHYWRPLIKNINTSESILNKVFGEVMNICDASVISGLRLNKNLFVKLTKLGADIQDWNGDSKHKYLPKEIIDKIIKIKNKKKPSYKIYLKTSCAISSLTGIPDFNFHFLKENKCLSSCQTKNLCKIGDAPEDEKIVRILKKLNLDNCWFKAKDHLFIKGTITQEEKACLGYNLKFPIKSEGIKLCASEKKIN